jgi:hypothetical protein
MIVVSREMRQSDMRERCWTWFLTVAEWASSRKSNSRSLHTVTILGVIFLLAAFGCCFRPKFFYFNGHVKHVTGFLVRLATALWFWLNWDSLVICFHFYFIIIFFFFFSWKWPCENPCLNGVVVVVTWFYLVRIHFC